MKNPYLIALITIILSAPLSAQHHFPKDSAEWKVYYKFEDVSQGPVTYKALKSHSYVKDTVIIGNSYKKITADYSKASPRLNMGYIREVDSTQKIYILLDDGAGLADHLLYDFSKSVGDTISIPVYPYGLPDTIRWYVFNEGQANIGQQQRRYMELEFIGQDPFQHGDSIYMDRWIEGIGSVRGLFAPLLDDGSYFIGESLRYHLVCFQDLVAGIQYEPELLKDSTFFDTGLYYYYDSTSNCTTAPWNNLSGEETALEGEEIEAYPNPFSEEFNIENNSGHTAVYTLFTTDGREVLKGKLRPYEAITIQRGHLPRGLYILKTATEGQVSSLKILHQ